MGQWAGSIDLGLARIESTLANVEKLHTHTPGKTLLNLGRLYYINSPRIIKVILLCYNSFNGIIIKIIWSLITFHQPYY